jgi:hypothetical protein
MMTRRNDLVALDLLLKGDQRGLTRMAQVCKDRLENRVECPECGDMGPHEDNGASGSMLCYRCTKCGALHEPA